MIQQTDFPFEIVPLDQDNLKSAIEIVRVCFKYDTEKKDNLPEKCIRASLEEGVAINGDGPGEVVSSRYWVLVEDENVYGIFGLIEFSEDFSTTDWLDWFAVMPSYRRKGYGAALLRHAIKLSKQRGKKIIRLWTSNAPNEMHAQPLYDKYGFVITSEKKERQGKASKTMYRCKTL